MLQKIVFIVTIALFGSSSALGAGQMVKGKYDIDPVHTRVSFTIPHFVISQVEGRFNDVSGSFTLGEPFTASQANVSVAIKSIDTGTPKRDDDLRSKNFFEVAKYPKMTFVTKTVTGTPDAFKATGMLTIKDVTKEVTFDGKFGGTLKDPWGARRAALQMTGKINRRDFHIDYSEMTELGPGIGDEVTIHISSDGTLAKK